MLILKGSRRRLWQLGYIPDLPDHRDIYSTIHETVKAVPKVVRLRHRAGLRFLPYNQGNFSSCTGNVLAAATRYALHQCKLPDFAPSRMAIYAGEREIEGSLGLDIGAMPRDGLKVLTKTGVASETLWPYDEQNFTAPRGPEYYTEAARHKVIRYERVPQTHDAIMRTLAAGYPICFGVTIYESFDTDATYNTGKIPMPKSSEKALGGHYLLATDGEKKSVGFANSWGLWGMKGFGLMPWDYVLNPDLAADFWVIKTVANVPVVNNG